MCQTGAQPFQGDNGNTVCQNALELELPDVAGYQATAQADDLIEGTVSLPPGEFAPAGGFRMEVEVWDRISYSDSVEVFIPEGAPSAPYSMTLPSEASAEWEVSYDCYSGCEPYDSPGYYATGGTIWISAAATLLAGGSDHNEINLVLMRDINSCALADETFSGPFTYTDEFYCSAVNSITTGGALGAPSPVIVGIGGYVVYSAPIIKLMPGFTVNGGTFRAGNNIR